jgi:hypothetical protein
MQTYIEGVSEGEELTQGGDREGATAIVGVFTVVEATTAFGMPIAVNLLARVTGGYAVPLVLLAAVTLAGAGLFHWGTAPAPPSGSRS